MLEMLPNAQQWERGPKITAIGGGTGLSTMLRGLKKYTRNLTAVVTVADDGGGSGVLRRDIGMPPPGRPVLRQSDPGRPQRGHRLL